MVSAQPVAQLYPCRGDAVSMGGNDAVQGAGHNAFALPYIREHFLDRLKRVNDERESVRHIQIDVVQEIANFDRWLYGSFINAGQEHCRVAV